GEASDGSDDAIEAIRRVELPQNTEEDETFTDRILHLKSQAPKLFEMNLFKPIAALSRRSWFRRLWVAQEYFFAKSVTFFCGRKSLDGRKLQETLSKLSIYSFAGTEPPIPDEESLFVGFESLRELVHVKADHAN